VRDGGGRTHGHESAGHQPPPPQVDEKPREPEADRGAFDEGFAAKYNEWHQAEAAEFNALTSGACIGEGGKLDVKLVKKWQADHGVEVDGKVGPATLRAARDAKQKKEAPKDDAKGVEPKHDGQSSKAHKPGSHPTQVVGEESSPPPVAAAAEEFSGAAFEDLRNKIDANPDFRNVAQAKLSELEQTKNAQQAHRVALAGKLEAMRRGMSFTPDGEEDSSASFWVEFGRQFYGAYFETLPSLLRQIKEHIFANAKKAQRLNKQLMEHGAPMGQTTSPIAVGTGETISDISRQMEEVSNEIEKALEAEAKTDKAIHLLRAALELGKAGLNAYSLAQPVVGAVEGGAAAGGGKALAAQTAGGGGVAVGAGEGAAAKVGTAPLQARAVGGRHDDLGSNPAGEDKSMHEGDAKQQQKAEKKDKRDAEPDTSKGKQATPTLADAVPAPGDTFDSWFDALTLKDLRAFLVDAHARHLIEAGIRHPVASTSG
jgi:peptidoglycan hydrolase-like protein with peptidoglycan-binding domain